MELFALPWLRRQTLDANRTLKRTRYFRKETGAGEYSKPNATLQFPGFMVFRPLFKGLTQEP